MDKQIMEQTIKMRFAPLLFCVSLDLHYLCGIQAA